MTLGHILAIFRNMYTMGRAYAKSHQNQSASFTPEAVNNAAELAAAQYEISQGQHIEALNQFTQGVRAEQKKG